MNSSFSENIRVQKFIVVVAVILFVLKMSAWYLTQSVAILTDGLESIINIVSGFIGLYSLCLAARPKDRSHPYGHGKIEFLSAGIEGALIFMAGIFIVYKAIESLVQEPALQSLDLGISLILVSAIINYVFGWWAVSTGKRNNSIALQGSGKHLQSDTYTTIGIIGGLVLIRFTDIYWIDGASAIFFAFLIMYSGYKILRQAIAGIMDESDYELLEDIVEYLEENRNPNWIDIHNLRITKYGSILQIDCHLTVPWYFTVREGHDENDKLENLLKSKFGERVEIIIHTDSCQEFSCKLCSINQCEVRKQPFEQRIKWTLEKVISTKKHFLK